MGSLLVCTNCELQKNKPKKPWVNNEIVLLINKKEKIYKKWKNELKLIFKS